MSLLAQGKYILLHYYVFRPYTVQQLLNSSKGVGFCLLAVKVILQWAAKNVLQCMHEYRPIHVACSAWTQPPVENFRLRCRLNA